MQPAAPALTRAFVTCTATLLCAAPAIAREPSTPFATAFGERFAPQSAQVSGTQTTNAAGTDLKSALLHWNQIAIDATGRDHTPPRAGESRVFGEQLGPTRSSRAMAIVHIAMSDAVAAVHGKYKSYTGVRKPPVEASLPVAVAFAAHQTLSALYPSQAELLDMELARHLAQEPRTRAYLGGAMLGASAAQAILKLRQSDGAQHAEPTMGVDWSTSNEAGHWRQDPVSLAPVALGAHWYSVKPFVLKTSEQFRVLPPPSMESAEYATAFNEVKQLGGDGIVTPTLRTELQSFVGVFWAYDGTPSLCAPPRLYNQITRSIAEQKNTSAVDLARLLALVNVSLADAGIAAWESKFHYDFWRPVTGIREADEGTGPTGTGDGNAATQGDLTFMPMGAPASNLHGPNFTPPFPSYPSGHATFGGALFQTLRNFYGSDAISFTFVSDEFNGVTRDAYGNVRPYIPRTFQNLSAAEEENGRSRVYLGIHWAFDADAGITQGNQIADYVFDHAFRPTK